MLGRGKMKYKCKECNVEFEFTKKDINTEIVEVTKRVDSNTYKIQSGIDDWRYFKLGGDKSRKRIDKVIRTYKDIEEEQKSVICPVCNQKNILVKKEVNIKKVYRDSETYECEDLNAEVIS